MFRAVKLLLPLAVLALAVGCEWMEKMKSPKEGLTTSGGPIKPVQAEELVSYLNTQAASLQSIRYPNAKVNVYAGGNYYPLNNCSLVCAKPRNFSLVGGRIVMSDLVNIGSNDQEFWMYSKYPEQNFIYCSHTDFPQAGRQLPVPFDPDWALPALGMTTYTPSLAYHVDTDHKNKEHRITFDTVTPQGTPVKREIVFHAYEVVGKQPQVKRHSILNTANKVIASAEVKEATTVPSGRDPQTGKPAYVQVPTVVVLHWPQQEFKMELTLGKPTVNERISESDMRGLFTRPSIDGASPINLAEARFNPSSTRGATPSDLPRRR